jgi:hypothetical protein
MAEYTQGLLQGSRSTPADDRDKLHGTYRILDLPQNYRIKINLNATNHETFLP